MPQYKITIAALHTLEFVKDALSTGWTDAILSYRELTKLSSSNNIPLSVAHLTLSLKEEDFVFLSLKYRFIKSVHISD